MTGLSETIFRHYQMRKTKSQKQAFITLLEGQLPGLRVEEGGFPKSRNLVLGDPASARVIFTAHYDTCAQAPFPNLITPRNIPLYIGINLLVCLPFLAVYIPLLLLLKSLLGNHLLAFLLSYPLFMAALIYVMMGGKPNPNTTNDNTSGVLTLIRIWESMTPQQREQACFVFFDNEEKGLLGSSRFRKAHKGVDWKKKLLVNFDCVSDGDHLLFVVPKAAKAAYGAALEASFTGAGEKETVFHSASTTIYPSDQGNFPLGVGVSSMNKKPFVGLYMDKIHTKRDTVMDEENLRLLAQGALSLMEKLEK